MERDEVERKEVAMLNKRKDRLKKSLAILACATLISMSFPGVTQAATKPSSKEFLNPEKLFSLISPILSLVNPNFSVGVYESGAAFYLFSEDKKPPAKEEEKDKQKQKSKSSYDKNGNSTSKRKANGKD
jgi:hypothetical protein